jgi:LPS O-antigen subunit length determinant protein (WzzB/FepE family)
MDIYTKSIDNLHKHAELDEPTWDTVIEDAEAQIERHKRRITKLEKAIKIAKDLMAKGVPFGSTHNWRTTERRRAERPRV